MEELGIARGRKQTTEQIVELLPSRRCTHRGQIGPVKSACRLKINSEVNSGEFVPNRRFLRHCSFGRSLCLRPGIARRAHYAHRLSSISPHLQRNSRSPRRQARIRRIGSHYLMILSEPNSTDCGTNEQPVFCPEAQRALARCQVWRAVQSLASLLFSPRPTVRFVVMHSAPSPCNESTIPRAFPV